MDGPGISIDDLPGIYREEYLYAVEIARAQHDPCLEWEAFRETLWRYLVRVFGIEDVTARLPSARPPGHETWSSEFDAEGPM